MPVSSSIVRLPLPKQWPNRIKSAVVHAVSLAQYAVTTAHAQMAKTGDASSRLRRKIERLERELAVVREEMRIKDCRLARIPSLRRPHYTPVERLHILEVRAARGWSALKTAERFHLSPVTVCSWTGRLNDESRLLQTREPVNKFPDFVAYIVRRLKALCPSMGKVRMA